MPALPAPEPLDIQVGPDDRLLPVGTVSAIVGPTIVVQVCRMHRKLPPSPQLICRPASM